MNNKNKPIIIGIPALIIVTLLIGMFIGGAISRRSAAKQVPQRGVAKLGEVFELLTENYIDPVNVDSIAELLIPDLLETLDPHTAYIAAEDFDNVNSELEGSFSGIGISYQIMNDTITVLEIISGGPAERVGLNAGDRIIAIDDSVMTRGDVSMNDVVKLLRGPEDTRVKVTVKRTGAPAPLDFDIVRSEIPVTSIDASYMITPTVGYIKVNTFGRNTFEEFYTEMIMLKAAGATDYIIDLRGNGGGYLDVAVNMADEFLGTGDVIVETRGRYGELYDRSVATASGSFKEGDLVVLMDDFSASASEIFAGAMQDNDRGVIVGRRSFGKGLVQTQHDLSDGSALRITVARYYTPSGRCIQKPFTRGDKASYSDEVFERYLNGEVFSADSTKLDTKLAFHTAGGRTVYGGGGIMPDVFVPADTANVTSYYSQVVNAGLVHRFSFRYADAHRAALDKATTADELMRLLPSDSALLSEFVNYAAANGVPARWYYINISRPLIVNLLKALIARDVLDSAAFYEIDNTADNAVNRALEIIAAGKADSILKK